MAVKEAQNGAPRHGWPDELVATTSKSSDSRYTDAAGFHAFVQFRFEPEWRELLDYAHERGIQVIGDIPMYVSDDSADAWSEPTMFSLGTDGIPYEVAGVPPDRFSATGQVWGNPTYRWDEMRKTATYGGSPASSARSRCTTRFASTISWDSTTTSASPRARTGTDGTLAARSRIELFQRAYEEFGPLPFIAEDLGLLTPGVRALCASCGFPGMDVLEFADNDIRQQICPHNEKVLYTSTHDTSTLVGFLPARRSARIATSSEAPYLGPRSSAMCSRARRRRHDAAAGPALMLGDEARVNVPGVAEGNWSWQADADDIEDAVDAVAHMLIETGARSHLNAHAHERPFGVEYGNEYAQARERRASPIGPAGARLARGEQKEVNGTLRLSLHSLRQRLRGRARDDRAPRGRVPRLRRSVGEGLQRERDQVRRQRLLQHRPARGRLLHEATSGGCSAARANAAIASSARDEVEHPRQPAGGDTPGAAVRPRLTKVSVACPQSRRPAHADEARAEVTIEPAAGRDRLERPRSVLVLRRGPQTAAS